MEDTQHELPASPVAGSTISPTGIWGDAEQDSHIFSYRLAKFIYDLVQPDEFTMIADYGCGKGEYIEYFNDRFPNSCFVGFEGSEVNSANICKFDLTKEITMSVALPFCNSMSIEVWEHIPQEFESIYVDNITRYCNGYLVLSVAVPGQEGLGHVNCRSNEYVIETITAKGFEYLPELTAQGRAVIENHCAYLRDSLLIFKRK